MRQRTPLAQAEATGAADKNKKRFADRVEPKPRGSLGPPPVTLDTRQKTLWAQLVSVVPEGVLTAADTYIVELTVRLLARMSSLDDPLKPVEIGHLRGCLGSLGLTPADRTRVNGSNEPEEEEDQLATLFGGGSLGAIPN